jgi:(2R)-3-sulfolactate dehydrogenase (NADP+)
MTQEILSVEAAHALVAAAMTASATSLENALAVAAALVGAELVGQGGHGLRRVSAYAAQARAGKVDGHASPRAVRTRPSAVHVDAAHGFAYPALALAAAELREMAATQGLAAAGVFRSHHAGVTGLAVEALASSGLVAFMVANAPPSMAPWGSTVPLFGTNPIAFACPVEGGPPMVIDLSLSKVARGKVMAASQKGETIPQGWAFDRDGRPTTDAREALAGTMVPAGEAKGTALALMVELMAAGLIGANFAYEQSSFFDDVGEPPGSGQLIIAIDPGAFGGVRALARFKDMATAVSRAEGARVPGARRHELRARMQRDGIPVDRAVLDDIRRIAAG